MSSALGRNINVLVGYYCNYRCRHCISSSGPDRKREEMGGEEIEALCRVIATEKPKLLLFTGGEPTLFPEVINRVAAAHPEPEQASFQITTNGWFAVNEKSIRSVLGKIQRLNAVQMSFDIYHGNESKTEYVKRLAEYCHAEGLKFNVTMCLSEPADLLNATAILHAVKAHVVFQQVTTTGRALEYKIGYHYPKFEKEALQLRCPNLGGVNYLPGRGFTVCGSNLTFGKEKLDVEHASIAAHEQSDFYQNLSKHTMLELAQKYAVDLSGLKPEHSHVCHLCEYIHTRGNGARKCGS